MVQIKGSKLIQVQQKRDSLFERLGSGEQANGADDGAVAQQIIGKLKSQVGGGLQVARNAYDVMSLACLLKMVWKE